MTDVNVTETIICVKCDETISTDKDTCSKCGKNWRNASVSVTGPEAIEGKT